MHAPQATTRRITLDLLCQMKSAGEKFAMLTAYDYPTAALAQAAGVHALLIGDSLATVILGHESTREAPFELMLTLAEAVRRGAPDVFFVGDMPYESIIDDDRALLAARRYRDEAGCDAVKFEAQPDHDELIERIASAGITTIAHLGLQPQQVLSPEGYRAQARDAGSVEALVTRARSAVSSGAAMLLLEAIPNEAAQAVIDAVPVPVIGCGAGPACDGHVLVTQDMLGLGAARPPKFVPRHAELGRAVAEVLRRYVTDIESGRYPAPEHVYPMRATTAKRD